MEPENRSQVATKLRDVIPGNQDQRRRTILSVCWTTSDYKVYEHDGGVSAHFSDISELASTQRARYVSIGPQLSEVNALRSTTSRSAAAVDREIARGIAACLEGDLDSAERTLATVRARLLKFRTIPGRFQYQTGALVAAVIAGLLCAAVRSSPAQEADKALSFFRLASVGGFAALGGFLSVSMGIRKLAVDPDADWWINAVAGATRIVIAVIGGIFVYLAVVSKLVLGSLSIMNSTEAMYAISMLAGFSETFVPNILRGLAATADKNSPETAQS